MVRRKDDMGGYYHEPPYTPEEEMEIYRRMSGIGKFSRISRGRPRPIEDTPWKKSDA